MTKISLLSVVQNPNVSNCPSKLEDDKIFQEKKIDIVYYVRLVILATNITYSGVFC